MNASEIAMALGDARREGRNWRCRCPLHGGHSLVIRDGDGGRVLATCWAGCDRLDLLSELRQRGLLGGSTHYARHVIPPQYSRDEASRTARALKIWRDTRHGARTIVSRYLASRGIALDKWPANLRFHPRCPRPRDDAGNPVEPLPAMIERVERGPTAVHCTYLRLDGSGKADIEKPKAIFGPADGGAVRFGALHAGEWLAVAEGIETALSVAVACSIPIRAALSAGGIKNLILPREATDIVICADHDASCTGERAARDAATRWLAEGRHVRLAMPPDPGADFNDVLTGRIVTKINEARHVA